MKLGGLPPQAFLTQDSFVSIGNANITQKISSSNLAAFSDELDTFTFGTAQSKTDKSIVTISRNGSTPTIRYNESQDYWEISNDGNTFTPLRKPGSLDGSGSTSGVDLDSAEVVGLLPIEKGGTGSSIPASARAALGLTIGVTVASPLKHNLDATIPPSTYDDDTQGYALGSLWIDTQTATTYVAIDVTPDQAVWKAVTTAGGMTELADGSVTEQQLAQNAVSTDKLRSASVTATRIRTDSVTDEHLSRSGVVPGTYSYSSLSVNAAGQVTSATSNPSSIAVPVGNATSGSTLVDDLFNGTALVYEGPTVDDSETSLAFQGDPVVDNTVVIPAVNGTLVTTGDAGTVSSVMLADGSVSSSQLRTSSVTSATIVDETITGSKLANDTLTVAQIGSNAVGSSELGSTSVTPGSYPFATLSIDQDGRITNASATSLSSVVVGSIGDATVGPAFADNVNNGTKLIYEGTSIDTFETSLAFTGNPTTSSVVTIPNRTGTIVTTGDTDSVTAGLILDATVANTDISPTASVDVSKLAPLTAGNTLVGNSSNVANSVALSGDATLNSNGVLTISANAFGAAEVVDGSVTSDDIADGTITTSDITDATVANIDISPSANITFSRLASLTSGNTLVGNSSNVAASAAFSGDATLSNTGVLTITTNAVGSAEIIDGSVDSVDIVDGTVTTGDLTDASIGNSDISSSAAIDFAKLASLTAGRLIIGSATNVATSTAISGDATLSSSGVFTVAANAFASAEVTDGSIVNADISSSAAIAFSKLASLTSATTVVGSATNTATGTSFSGDATLSNTGAVTITSNALGSAEIIDESITTADISDATVTSTDITDGTLTNADFSASAAIAFSKLALTSASIAVGDGSNAAVPVSVSGDATLSNTGVLTITTDALGSSEVTDGTIANADIGGSAAIAFSKLASLPAGQTLVGDATNVATAVSLSGDATLDSTGSLAIADDSVDGTDISISGEASGSLLTFDGTNWVNVASAPSGLVLTSNGANRPPSWRTIPSASGPRFPQPIMSRRTGWVVPAGIGGATLDAVGVTTPAVFNAGTAQAAGATMFIRYPTTATINSDGGFSGPYTSTRLAFSPVLTAVIRTDPTTLTSSRIHVGLSSATLATFSPAASGTTTTHFASLSFDTGSSLSATNWLCCVGNGANYTCRDTGTAVAAATQYTISVDLSVGGVATCTVNNVVTAGDTTLPATTTDLGVFMGVRTLTAAIRSLDFAKFSLGQN